MEVVVNGEQFALMDLQLRVQTLLVDNWVMKEQQDLVKLMC